MKANIRLKIEGGDALKFHSERVEIGSEKALDVSFDPNPFPMVSERHAHLAFECGIHVLYDNASAQGTFVNGERISVAKLKSGDRIRLGQGGPTLLFEDGSPFTSRLKFVLGRCGVDGKMLQVMVSDSLAEVTTGKGKKPEKASGIVQEVLGRVKLQQSIRLLTAVFVGLLLTAGSVAGILLWTGRRLKGLEEVTFRRASERATLMESRERDFRRRIRGLKSELVRKEASASTEVDALRSNLKNLRETLEENRRGFWAIAERNQKAVVLLQHTFQVFNLKTGRTVRVVSRRANGAPMFSEGPVGVPVTLSIQGTGFVIDPRGTILTNRHVAEPWRENDRLRSAGWSGRTVLLSATFADTDRPVPAKILKVSREVDAAALRIDPFPGMPVVQAIEPDPKKVRQGLRVAIIGFPSGVMMEGKAKTTLTTGVLSKVNLRKELQFDAPVNPGNSGGPIFNERGHVIGIVHAVGVGPGGARLHGISYGVPIRFATSLAAAPDRVSGLGP